MNIESQLLTEYGAQLIVVAKKEVIFQEGTAAYFFFQVVSGEVQMSNDNEEGKSHIQGIFGEGKSFGEPPLFGDFHYPANAIAAVETQLLRLPKQAFLQLLKDHSDIHLQMTAVLAQRLFFKARLASEISMNPPHMRIMALLKHLKTEIFKIDTPFGYEVQLTRQEIANLTGLRVETVIRTLKQLDKEKKVLIRNRKVYY